ncbi:APH(3'') family aminoglycoside O-phosphotransferase [Saccharopolyspora elongata]|uniref:APH(3'') family aminoglycoside O-phosphotransferase n=1 Tax=Saccharopolyspora elongata TaxID=2530387 RepID=A0A4R4YGM2_9PSEU|nr:APH(3'') family aminoglycoside O-phosphotransferase [Saccharopolyspora elongata]TDD43049.1 APH(3'') family aminoglycoside O-phosphotransferase [Saccharopolyspora elongata]
MSESLRVVLPAGHEWHPVLGGESGAGTFRSADGSRYAKCVAADQAGELEQERDKAEWLCTNGIPGPRVLDWSAGDEGACLVTSAVAGVPADAVPAETLARAWESISDAVRRLHELPAGSCPFSRDLSKMFAIAQDVVARGAVNPEFLPVEQQQEEPVVLLADLAPQLPQRLEQEAAETVVCHGDLCLPNIILDPDALEVAGFIDLGRLGTADPYADIALLLANSRETWPDESSASVADETFARRYGIELDADRQRFYLHLDPLTWG